MTRDREQFTVQTIIAYSLGAPIPEPLNAEEHKLAEACMRGVDEIKARGGNVWLPATLP